nr:unnamed protein product [Spirometra erinaceieuropaei]
MPRSVSVRAPARTDFGREVARSCSRRLLRTLINECHIRLRKYSRNIEREKAACAAYLDEQTMRNLQSWILIKVSEERDKKKTQLLNKTRNLEQAQAPVREPLAVHNLSSKQLTDDQIKVLQHESGYNTGDAQPVDFIAALEVAFSKTDAAEDSKKAIRQRVASLIISHRPRRTITSAELKTIWELKNDDEIVIVPADKGRAAVVLDKSEYVAKAHQLLNDNQSYKVIDADPMKALAALNEIRLAEEIKDLRVEVKDRAEVHANRIILAARIPSLRATLSGPLGEKNSVLRWPTMPLSLATTFMQYVYTGRVEIREDNAKGLVTLARMLELPHLVDWGVAFMARGLTLENLSNTLDFARSLNVEALTEGCIGLMKGHFDDFVPTDLFVRLPARTLLTLLQSEDLSVASEEHVIAAIARWVDAGAGVAGDDERLKAHAPTMLKEVQWQQTTVECRDRLLKNYPTFSRSPDCLCLMFQALNWIGAADKEKRPCPFNIRPRVRQTFFGADKDQTIFLFGVDRQNDDDYGDEEKEEEARWSVLRWNPHLQQAERVADMENGRTGASYSVVGENAHLSNPFSWLLDALLFSTTEGSIFVVGGRWRDDSTRRVDEFLVREGRWRERASLAVGRSWGHAAAVVKVPTAAADGEETLIGVFGGAGLSSCEVYDVRQNRWHKLPNLLEERWGSSAACLPGDSRVFVCGGESKRYNWFYDEPSFVDERYTPLASVVFCHLRADWRRRQKTISANFWQSAAPMRTARSRLAATAFRGAILVAGGEDDEGRSLSTVEMFTPPDASSPLGQWTELADMQEPRRLFTFLTFANAVFALGGYGRHRINCANRTASTSVPPPNSSSSSTHPTNCDRFSGSPFPSSSFSSSSFSLCSSFLSPSYSYSAVPTSAALAADTNIYATHEPDTTTHTTTTICDTSGEDLDYACPKWGRKFTSHIVLGSYL